MVRLSASLIAASLSYVAAYPGVANLVKRTEPPAREPITDLNRPNTGFPPRGGFNAADQYVDVTDGGEHPWIAPTSGDKRGQCPGLNAAANHGFISRTGVTTIAEAIKGLGQLYNLDAPTAGFLATVAVATSGDPVTTQWSIGGAFTPSLPISQARGIIGTHNKYENDASIVRGDAYLNNGNPAIFQMRSWESAYAFAQKNNNNFGYISTAAQSDYVTRWSIENNPYYFSGPFSGVIAPAAHNLVVGLMSNHSAANPGGELPTNVMSSFFSVTGEPGNFVYTRGHERVPLNWYRRSTADAYGLANVAADLAAMQLEFPGILRFGGNTGTINSFSGVDLGDLTGGVTNAQSLFQGNNFACFLYQASLAGLPDAAAPGLGAIGSILDWATSQVAPLQQALSCPQLDKFNNDLFNKFPGASYTGSQ